MSDEAFTFGRYVLLKRIAIGGMAEVFRAMAYGQKGFEKQVAIKRMLPHLSNDAPFVDMFINEAKIAADLNHANIVQIFDFGSIDGLLYLSMEYVRGKNIAEIMQLLKNRGLTAPVELCCFVFIEVLKGLKHAHQLRDRQGNPLDIIHRDISPPNLMVSYNGEVKITDFGIAKATQNKIHTVSGVLKGKYAYMSPEQAGGRPLNFRSDLFSAGICLYELLTLTEAFAGHSDMEVIRQVREAACPPLRVRDPDLPVALEKILQKALAKQPQDRYQSADEWREALEKFLADSGLRFTSAWLANFMADVFREEIEREQKQQKLEAAIAERLRDQVFANSFEEPSSINTLVLPFDSPYALPNLSPRAADPMALEGEYSQAETIHVDLQQLGLAQPGSVLDPGTPAPEDTTDSPTLATVALEKFQEQVGPPPPRPASPSRLVEVEMEGSAAEIVSIPPSAFGNLKTPMPLPPVCSAAEPADPLIQLPTPHVQGPPFPAAPFKPASQKPWPEDRPLIGQGPGATDEVEYTSTSVGIQKQATRRWLWLGVGAAALALGLLTLWLALR